MFLGPPDHRRLRQVRPVGGGGSLVLVAGLPRADRRRLRRRRHRLPRDGCRRSSELPDRRTEGNNVLDAARAARDIPETHASSDLLLWGHSQGGQAALFAATAARPTAGAEAPGVAAAAPPPTSVSCSTITGTTVRGDDRLLCVRLDRLGLRAEGSERAARQRAHPRPARRRARRSRRLPARRRPELHDIAEPGDRHFFAVDPATTQPWQSILEANTPATPRSACRSSSPRATPTSSSCRRRPRTSSASCAPRRARRVPRVPRRRPRADRRAQRAPVGALDRPGDVGRLPPPAERHMLNGFVDALQFLTRIPIEVKGRRPSLGGPCRGSRRRRRHRGARRRRRRAAVALACRRSSLRLSPSPSAC